MDSDSNDSLIECEQELNSHITSQKGRKNIRNVKQIHELSAETRLSNIKEDERLKRLECLRKKLLTILKAEKFKNQLILDYDFENNSPLISVHENLLTNLKDHQVKGVKFMWEACYESVEQINKSAGSGCILAHCMGLGKTLQVITLIHTLLNHRETKTKTVLICCPKNTLLNWINEFEKWIPSDAEIVKIYNPTKFEDHNLRSIELSMWQLYGGVCIINYELYRILLENEKKNTKQFPLKLREKFYEHLINPGPDLIVCDEGHILKNEDTKLSKIMTKIRTSRRIILTGTPMQNNLREYHCMIQFVKPSLLGTRKEFLNMFVNPISNGQYENSLLKDVRLMKERSHILHQKLIGCVQRFDLSVLKSYLPEKTEYVIALPLTDCQIDMYRFFLENYSAKGDWKNKGTLLLADYQALHRIWTHPYTWQLYEDKCGEIIARESENIKKKKKKRKRIDDYDEEGADDSSDFETCNWRRYPLYWWHRFVSSDSLRDARSGNKLVLLLKILKKCEDAGEKILLFTVSLFSMRMIEHFLKRINRACGDDPELCNVTSSWEENEDYVILTGETSSKDRNELCKRFNDAGDSRLRLFMISTKAGGMGINLTAANRAILFDVSWNPSHDTQSIFRIYRLGQTRPCFVYRFVSSGTMEEKIYERQVAKQSISHRVVDELETARHFTRTELLELYKLEPYKRLSVDVHKINDPFLRDIVNDSPGIIQSVHEHDSLLEHKEEEELEEAEKVNAWTTYKKDNDYDVLPENVRKMLEELKPEDFDPYYLRLALQNKYGNRSEREIVKMIDDVMPKIVEILSGPDFIDVMKREALLVHGCQPSAASKSKEATGLNRPSSKNGKFRDVVKGKESRSNSIRFGGDYFSPGEPIEIVDVSDKENDVIVEEVLKNPVIIDLVSSESDDDDRAFRSDSLVKSIRKRRKYSAKPLKSWGAKNGKEYGIPDTD